MAEVRKEELLAGAPAEERAGLGRSLAQKKLPRLIEGSNNGEDEAAQKQADIEAEEEPAAQEKEELAASQLQK